MKNEPFWAATGELSYGLTNDYMFRALLQKNNCVLKALTCSLLHLKESEVASVTITNPIELGTAVDNKTFILDIKAGLENGDIINYEMQVVDYKNWPERSLSYLCHEFDSLYAGQDYKQAKNVTHVGFLNFTLFDDSPEFVAVYRMLNEKNYRLYTEKFTLKAIDLTRVDLATDEDKKWQIDRWARVFKAKTWEEIKKYAMQSEVIQEMAATVYAMSEDQMIQAQCRAREEYNRMWSGIYDEVEQTKQELASLTQELNSKTQELDSKTQELNSKTQELDFKTQELNSKTQELDFKTQELDSKTQELDSLQKENIQLRKLLEQYQND